MSEPIETEPAPGPLGDERLRFYLRHRRQIEEWELLATEVRNGTVELFAGLGPELEALAESGGDDVRYTYEGDGRWPHHIFHRTSWLGPGEKRVVSVVFECARDRVDPASLSAPYVGVLLQNPAVSKATAEHLKDALGGLRPKYKKLSNWWAIHRVLTTSSSAWWEDLSAWRTWLLQEVEESWHELDPIVSSAVADPLSLTQ